jgi:hypothetical protein
MAPEVIAKAAEIAPSAPDVATESAPAQAAPFATASGPNESAASAPTPASESPSASPAVAAPGGMEVGAPIPTPEEIFAQSSAALAALQSYRYATVFSFTGEGQAGPKSGSVEVRGAVAGPDRREMTWVNLDTGEEFGVLRVGDLAWMLDGETWNGAPTAVADVMSELVLTFVPSMTWSGFAEGMATTSTYVGTETANGVTARHYTSTYRGWSQYWEGGIRDALGDVWIAEAGYPLRYRFTARGLDKDGFSGSMLWTMELSDVNGSVTIEAPRVSGDSGAASAQKETASPTPQAEPAGAASEPAALPPTAAMVPTSSTPAAPPATEGETSPAMATVPSVPVAPLVLPEGAEAGLEAAAAALDELFASSSDALAGLASYRYTTVFSFTGETDGKPESGSVEVHGAVAGPDRQQATWKNLETGEEFGVVRVGDQAWMLEGETWTPVPEMVADIMSQAILAFAPSMSWDALAEGMGTASTYVGTETVNGIPSRHYTSTYQGWSEAWEGEVDDASGDVWIAEAGYPVRYRFAATGTNADGSKGTALWAMELSDVNGSITIAAPQETADPVPVSP